MKKILVLLSSMLCLVTASNANAYQQYTEQCVGQCTYPYTDSCVGQCEPSCGRIYVGAFGGANWLNIKKQHGFHVKTKTGFAGGLSAGYKFNNGIRVEGEVAYRQNKIDSNHVKKHAREYLGDYADIKVDGKFHTWSYMANFLYDFENCSDFVPYLGFGLGYAEQHGKVKGELEGFKSSDRGSRKGFAYQGIAGVGYNLTESTTLALEYRYFKGEKKLNDHGLCLAVRQSF